MTAAAKWTTLSRCSLYDANAPFLAIAVVNSLYSFLYLFYSTFGITPPKRGEEARALFWLIVIVLGSAVFVAATLFAIYKIMV